MEKPQLNSVMTLLENSLKFQSSATRFEKRLIYSQNKAITVESGHLNDFTKAFPLQGNQQLWGTLYRRIGQTLFMSESLPQFLPTQLYKSLQSNTILIPNMWESILYPEPLFIHSRMAIQAVIDINSSVGRGDFLELGSADAPLSLLALHLGAKHAYAVERDSGWQARLSFEPNGMSGRATFIRADIQWLEKHLNPAQRSRITVAAANIGPHYDLYGNSHIVAINQLRYLPNCKYFIGGGYCTPHLDGFVQAIKELSKEGFLIQQFVSSHPQTPTHFAFIAQKVYQRSDSSNEAEDRISSHLASHQHFSEFFSRFRTYCTNSV